MVVDVVTERPRATVIGGPVHPRCPLAAGALLVACLLS